MRTGTVFATTASVVTGTAGGPFWVSAREPRLAWKTMKATAARRASRKIPENSFRFVDIAPFSDEAFFRCFRRCPSRGLPARPHESGAEEPARASPPMVPIAREAQLPSNQKLSRNNGRFGGRYNVKQLVDHGARRSAHVPRVALSRRPLRSWSG